MYNNYISLVFEFTSNPLDALDSLLIILRLGLFPEHINNHPETAPSKRIRNCCKGYNKPLHGSALAKDIGLDTIRQECQHFHQWLLRLENINSI